MFQSPLTILTGAAIALAGLYLLLTSLFFPSIHAGIPRDHRGLSIFWSLLMIAAGVLGVIRTWKHFFVETRLPSPPRLFREDPAEPPKKKTVL